MPLLPFEGSLPEVAEDAWVAAGAALVGGVRAGAAQCVERARQHARPTTDAS